MTSGTDINNKQQWTNWGLASAISAGGGYLALKNTHKLDKKIFSVNPAQKFALTDSERDIFIKKAQEIIDNGKLKDFGTKICFVDENTSSNSKNLIKSLDAIKLKKNACYFSKDKTVYINKGFMAPVFHELGHAESHRAGLSNVLLRMSKNLNRKGITLGIPLIALLLNKKKATPEKHLTQKEKSFNKLRNNIGFITALVAVPRLLEESIASLNGSKMAKKVGLNNKLLKIVEKTHRWGFGGYCRNALYYPLIIFATIKTKDYLQEKLPLITNKMFNKTN